MALSPPEPRTVVTYGIEPDLDVAEFRRVLVESGLAPRRPADDPVRLEMMLAAADLVVTARRDGALVGVARTLTDFSFCAYLSDLAVCRSAQGLGIGQGLIAATRKAIGPQASLLLTAAPDAITFYERIAMPRVPDAFRYDREA
ncbi:GCN5 family acetyltransferase [Methylobacterium sp. Leaf87]|uniref:GNAT family N-acetyltransferase n=1 Tax=Methylobacterium sp. Leaf87 TaxID=1736243 RepID=UPI0006FE7430|nr:GNAT family N-acetyltransferase [Methylobacterium sp. Leaf87]KQO59508.1 GCN5 family acetyltransferase [Methylobacterium sp. Leaf87]